MTRGSRYFDPYKQLYYIVPRVFLVGEDNPPPEIPDCQFGGVVQYDTGVRRADGRFLRIGLLNTPPTVLLAVLQKLKSNHQRGIDKCAE
jgi:hypothetical protein